ADLQTQNADFPRRVAAIDACVKAYASYQGLHGAIDDVAELKRLLRGSGVLEFHILADTTSPPSDVRMMIARLADTGPAPVAGDKLRWYAADQPADFQGDHYGFAQD